MGKILCIISIVFLFACNKNEIVYEKGISVNCLFDTISPLSVFVTETNNAFKPDSLRYIKDVKIKLYENDIYLNNISWTWQNNYIKPYYYSGNFNAKPGNNYRIELNINDKIISSNASLPKSLPIISIDTLSYLDRENVYVSCNLKFKDEGNTDNYYGLIAYTVRTYNVYGTVHTSNQKTVNGIISGNRSVIGLFAPPVRAIFDDRTFNGEVASLPFIISWQAPEKGFAVEERLYIGLACFTKETFLNLKTLANYFNSKEDIFSIPVKALVDIQGGYGFFGGYSLQMKSFSMNRFYVPKGDKNQWLILNQLKEN
jgi:hypothetical protein